MMNADFNATVLAIGLIVETKFSRIPVYEKSLDDIIGVVMARDILEVPDREAAHRTVRELMRPALIHTGNEIRIRAAEGNAAQESADGDCD